MTPREVVVLLTGHAELTKDGNLLATATVTLVRGSPNIVVDTGDAWQRDEILAALSTYGVAPSEVDYVVNTHGHLDHLGNNSVFPDATFVLDTDVGRRSEYSIHDFARAPFCIGAPGSPDAVQVIASPGHTNHDLSVMVPTASGMVAVVGDLFERDRDWEDNAWEYWSKDPEQQRLSRRRIAGLADFIVPGHGGIFPMTAGLRTLI